MKFGLAAEPENNVVCAADPTAPAVAHKHSGDSGSYPGRMIGYLANKVSSLIGSARGNDSNPDSARMVTDSVVSGAQTESQILSARQHRTMSGNPFNPIKG